MAIDIELVYDRRCPNVAAVRWALRVALVTAGMRPVWREWARGAADAPAHAIRYGSPTILINGADVCAGTPDVGAG